MCNPMQINADRNRLNAAEVTDDLHINECKFYEPVADQAIPWTTVTGEWLFPRTVLDRWRLG
jgi:putative molybdopterin biosynthesis protein